jgi:hypothetical protein
MPLIETTTGSRCPRCAYETQVEPCPECGLRDRNGFRENRLRRRAALAAAIGCGTGIVGFCGSLGLAFMLAVARHPLEPVAIGIGGLSALVCVWAGWLFLARSGSVVLREVLACVACAAVAALVVVFFIAWRR